MNPRLLRAVGVLEIQDTAVDTMRRFESVGEVSLGAGVLHLFVAGIAAGDFIDHRCELNRMEATGSVIFAKRE
jgi:hypothetical protein